MLYPQSNRFRQYQDLSGIWEFRSDLERIDTAAEWRNGFVGGRPIAVPASWNDQFVESRDMLGSCWYQTRFNLPWGWNAQDIELRFNSVHYLAEVWLNGIPLGSHEGGHLPFTLAITDVAQAADNILVVRVDGQLAPDRVPPGNVPIDPLDTFANETYPATTFDFFPYCGIDRPVLLVATPPAGIQDLTVTTNIVDQDGIVAVHIQRATSESVKAHCTIDGHGDTITADLLLEATGEVILTVPHAALWSPAAPNLYTLTVELLVDDITFDGYTLSIGIRTIAIQGMQLLLNGEPIILRGFCRHEDFPIVGRGYLPAVLIKDYALLEWVGANSFRTTHYPYSEPMMDLADRLGFLVIDEIPAVGLFFREEGLERRHTLCRQYVSELIDRDKNHPAVIMWSLANEPHSERPAAPALLRDLYGQAKSLDPSRPATIVSLTGEAETAFEVCDVVCVNRYLGWYTQVGQIAAGCRQLAADLDGLAERFGKPIILSEFGAEALVGHHASPPEMFSEEYQADFLLAYVEVLERHPAVVGMHIWNLCDFKTSQSVHRVGGMNMKGIFTRDRRPKLAAHRLRERWLKGASLPPS